MSLFVEVDSVEKGCTVIINLDTVMEIAPLRTGGCEIAFPDGAAVNGKRTMKVKDNYTQFQQFVMTSVSADMIADRIQKISDAVPAEMKKPNRKIDKMQEVPVFVGKDSPHL
jgi:hypothetical protein